MNTKFVTVYMEQAYIKACYTSVEERPDFAVSSCELICLLVTSVCINSGGRLLTLKMVEDG